MLGLGALAVAGTAAALYFTDPPAEAASAASVAPAAAAAPVAARRSGHGAQARAPRLSIASADRPAGAGAGVVALGRF